MTAKPTRNSSWMIRAVLTVGHGAHGMLRRAEFAFEDGMAEELVDIALGRL